MKANKAERVFAQSAKAMDEMDKAMGARKRGRPRKKTDELLILRSFSLSIKEWEAIQHYAHEERVSVSAWCREAVRQRLAVFRNG